MSSPPPPSYDNATDISRFHDLIAYASTHGAYLLQTPNIKYSTLPMKTARISIIFSLSSPSLSPLKISELYADYVPFKYLIFGKLTELMTDYSLTTLDSSNEYTKNIIQDNTILRLL